jgi:hypothetical protein
MCIISKWSVIKLDFLEKIGGEHQLSLGSGDQVWKVRFGPQADFAYSSLWKSQVGHHCQQHARIAVSY